MKKRVLLIMLLVVSLVLVSCGKTNTENEVTDQQSEESVTNEEVKDEGPLVVGQAWVASDLDPTNSSVPWTITTHGISEYVYHLNEKGELVSRFIDSLEQVDDLNWNVVMKKGAKFSDGSDVDAKALCEAMNAIQEKNEFSNATAGKIVFTPTEEYAFTVKTERPTRVLKSIFSEWTNVVFKDLGNGEFIFTGPYMVKELDPNVEVTLTPNPHYPGAEKRKEVIIKSFQDISSMKLAFESGEIDMAFTVSPEIADMLEKEGHKVQTIDAGYQYFGLLNLEHELLKDQKMRQVLDLALNREDYVTALKGGRVGTGLFAQYYDFAGDIELEHNADKAKALLDEMGWKEGADGIREKDGKKLEFRIVTYPSRPDLTIIMQVMSSQLKEIGILSTTELQDDICAVGQSGEFDILLYAQHTAPTGEPSYILSQFFRTGEASNFARYSSNKYDAIMDKIGSESSEDERNKLAIEAQRQLHEDLPVLFLVDPEWHIALSERMGNYKPYCGDYYIINENLGLE